MLVDWKSICSSLPDLCCTSIGSRCGEQESVQILEVKFGLGMSCENMKRQGKRRTEHKKLQICSMATT